MIQEKSNPRMEELNSSSNSLVQNNGILVLRVGSGEPDGQVVGLGSDRTTARWLALTILTDHVFVKAIRIRINQNSTSK